jgi:hypothetical protein
MILTQLIPYTSLAKLNEVQLATLVAHLETELVTNSAVKSALTGRVNEVLKSLGH